MYFFVRVGASELRTVLLLERYFVACGCREVDLFTKCLLFLSNLLMEGVVGL